VTDGQPDPDRSFAAGHAAGEIAARLAEHDRHFERINGSMEHVAEELHNVVLGIQRLGDAADADRQTARITAAALKEQEQARRDKSETRWTPMSRLITVIVAVAVIAGAVIAYAALGQK
jgi:hypothetical protein